MKLKTILTLGAALASGAVLAQDITGSGKDATKDTTKQQQGPTMKSPVGAGASVSTDFGRLDVNTDNALSLDEVSSNPALSQAFTRLDRNGDGNLNTGEFARFEGEDEGSAGKAKKESDNPAKKAKKEAEQVDEKIESGND